MAMNNDKLPSFSRSDKQIADAFGMSLSDFKKVKKQIVSDITNPKATPKATTKPMTLAQKQAKAMAALEAKRAAVAKKTGVRPNYRTN